ncbi:MAG: YtxH domain-containing protein [Byssovorax sp.]
MSTTLNDTIKIAKNVLAAANEEAGHAVGTAKHAFGTAKVGAEHAASSARSTWLDGVKAAAGLIAVMRGFQAEDALGWVGLTRRRSPFAAIGLLGAGALVGAGVAMLFAPQSGAETRRRIMKGIEALKGDAQSTIDRAEAEVKMVGDKVEEIASHAKDAVIQAEHKVEEGAVALKDMAASKVDAAVHAVKDATSSARSDKPDTQGGARASSLEASKPSGSETGSGRKINHPS